MEESSDDLQKKDDGGNDGQTTELDFIYNDADEYGVEIAEFYSYSEEPEFFANRAAFQKEFTKYSSAKWVECDEHTRQTHMTRLLDQFEIGNRKERSQATRGMLYLLQGVFADCELEEDQITWARRNVYMAIELGLLNAAIGLLLMEIQYNVWTPTGVNSTTNSGKSTTGTNNNADGGTNPGNGDNGSGDPFNAANNETDGSASEEQNKNESSQPTPAEKEAKKDSTDLRVILALLYTMVETVRDGIANYQFPFNAGSTLNNRCTGGKSGTIGQPPIIGQMSAAHLLVDNMARLREQFVEELASPLANDGTESNLAIVLFGMVHRFSNGLAPHFPMKKTLLLLWKVVLVTLGPVTGLFNVKNSVRNRYGLPSLTEDTHVVIRRVRASSPPTNVSGHVPRVVRLSNRHATSGNQGPRQGSLAGGRQAFYRQQLLEMQAKQASATAAAVSAVNNPVSDTDSFFTDDLSVGSTGKSVSNSDIIGNANETNSETKNESSTGNDSKEQGQLLSDSNSEDSGKDSSGSETENVNNTETTSELKSADEDKTSKDEEKENHEEKKEQTNEEASSKFSSAPSPTLSSALSSSLASCLNVLTQPGTFPPSASLGNSGACPPTPVPTVSGLAGGAAWWTIGTPRPGSPVNQDSDEGYSGDGELTDTKNIPNSKNMWKVAGHVVPKPQPPNPHPAPPTLPPSFFMDARTLPWKPKVRTGDLQAFIDAKWVKYVGFSVPNDTTSLAGLPKPIHEAVRVLRAHFYQSLGEVQISREAAILNFPMSMGGMYCKKLQAPTKSSIKRNTTRPGVAALLPCQCPNKSENRPTNNNGCLNCALQGSINDKINMKYPMADACVCPSCSLENQPETRRTERLYRAMYSQLSHYMIALLKVLLASAPTSRTKLELINLLAEIQYNDNTTLTGNPILQSTILNIDISRHREIIVKAISGLLLLLLKHFKVNHIYQFEYISQYLVFANCIPLILKFFNQNTLQYVQSKNSLPSLDFPARLIGDAGAGECGSELTQEALTYDWSSYCWRNLYTCINLLRVLNMLTKWKHSRTMLLLVFKSAPILKRALRVRHAMMQFYVLKLLKMQSRYLGQQWRKSNMGIMSAIYQKVRHRLTDDWAYANDVNSQPWEFQTEETALRSNMDQFHQRRYSENWLEPIFEPIDNCIHTVLSQPIELSPEFKRNYEKWLEEEVFSVPINWDLVLAL